ncbi:MAG: chromosomal replication initiator protein DnaA [Patescibacteria group bacterium]|nr:chromosomal replication initiator protein DnaA [Patescibacteria group bacterium]
MTKDELWQAVLGELELSISKASFTTWFKNTAVYDMNDDGIIVTVPNIFAKEWLEKKYKRNILDSVHKHYPKINHLSCHIGNKSDTAAQQSKSIDSIVTNPPQAAQAAVHTKQSSFSPTVSFSNSTSSHFHFSTNLNKRYTFDVFVVGANNELAYAACRSIAENPGQNYNPLFIYGGVGLGKTHLLQSTGNYALQVNPRLKVRYLSMERFTNELVDAIQRSKAKEFKNNYIDLDVLILDDVQFLSGKEKTQEEFFHVFESLYQHGKQIILSSDRAPKSIPTLEDRLRSRFEGGMMADVNKPDLETRIAIIQAKLGEKQFSLPDEIIDYLAEHIYHNVRELEGALNKIIVTFQLNKNKPQLSDIKDLTKDVISVNRTKALTPEKILCSVADFYEVKREEISGRCRKKNVVKPRQIAIYLLRNETGLSFPEIGNAVGGRDHSTAIYAFEKIKKELDKNDLLQDQLKFIREKFIDY